MLQILLHMAWHSNTNKAQRICRSTQKKRTQIPNQINHKKLKLKHVENKESDIRDMS